MKKLILSLLIFCAAFVSCNDDDDMNTPGSTMRVKRIEGENSVWGKYRLEFNYEPDGRLKESWRFDAQTGDTTGIIKVEYDLSYYLLSFVDYVAGVDADSVALLRKKYPDTWKDSLRTSRTEQILCSVELKDGRLTKKYNRPRRDVGSGTKYNPNYVQVATYTQISELANGVPVVIRCYDNVFGSGAANTTSVRTVSKYEFTYDNGDLVSGERYLPDTYNETSWTKVSGMSFSTYSGIVTGVESETYKMRRSKNMVAVAESGRTLTYTLNEQGLAIRLETSDAERATFEYESGRGNFYELFAMPLERVLGKVWVK